MNNLKIVKIVFVAVMVFVSAGALSVDGQRRERTRTWGTGQTVDRDMQRRSGRTLWSGRQTDRRTDRRWNRDSNRRHRVTYGYRNYGQYRRTQVGNRRYRMVNRYTWQNGRRVTRRVRINY
jgi:hypothetical protein